MILKLILQAIMPVKGQGKGEVKENFLVCCGVIRCVNSVYYRIWDNGTPLQKIWTKGLPDRHFMHYVIRFARLSGKCITIPAEKLDDVFDAARNPTSPESLQLLEEELLRLKKEKEKKEQERREALERKEQQRLIIWDSLSDAEKALLIRWAKNH
jgi:hypothetical protein